MATSLKTIKGNILDPSGAAVAGAKVSFALKTVANEPLVNGSASVVGKVVSATTSGAGYCEIDLVTNDATYSGTLYEVSVAYLVGGNAVSDVLGQIQVASDGSSRLEDLLTQGVVLGRDLGAQVAGFAVQALDARNEAQNLANGVDPDHIAEVAIEGAKSSSSGFPNFLQGTRKYEGLCFGEVGVAHDVRTAGVVDGPWAMRISEGVDATLKVVEMDDPEIASITSQRGELTDLLGNDDTRMDMRCLIVDVTITSDDEEAMFDLRQLFGGAGPTHYGGRQVQQGHAGVAVLDHSGDAFFKLFGNWADATIDNVGGLAGAGWRFVKGVNTTGARWAEVRNQFRGVGRQRVAIILPCCVFGSYGDAQFWVPSNGSNPYWDAE